MPVDEVRVCARPSRGEETAFRVRFDPNPDPCYTALRAGVATDALGLVVAAMDAVRIYRTREVATAAYGLVAGAGKELYLAAEIHGHRGLVRDVAWAPGNIRGYDVVATACQDGFVRVVRLDTPFDPDDGRSWSSADLVRGGGGGGGASKERDQLQHQHQPQPSTTAISRPTAAAAAAADPASAPSSRGPAAAPTASAAPSWPPPRCRARWATPSASCRASTATARPCGGSASTTTARSWAASATTGSSCATARRPTGPGPRAPSWPW